MKSFRQFLKEKYELENEGYTQEVWDKLDSATKLQYLKDHPNSKYNPENFHDKGVTYNKVLTKHLSKIYDTIVSKEPKITDALLNITKKPKWCNIRRFGF